jgi:hypothetical protein
MTFSVKMPPRGGAVPQLAGLHKFLRTISGLPSAIFKTLICENRNDSSSLDVCR